MFLRLTCFEGVGTFFKKRASRRPRLPGLSFRLVTELSHVCLLPSWKSFLSPFTERLSIIVQTNDTGPSFSNFFKKRGDPWPCSPPPGGQEGENRMRGRSLNGEEKTPRLELGIPSLVWLLVVPCWRTGESRRSHVTCSIVFWSGILFPSNVTVVLGDWGEEPRFKPCSLGKHPSCCSVLEDDTQSSVADSAHWPPREEGQEQRKLRVSAPFVVLLQTWWRNGFVTSTQW